MSVRILFKPQDLWVGVFWNVTKHQYVMPTGNPAVRIVAKEFSVYMCLLPCFPIRVRWIRGYKVTEAGELVRISK